MDGLHLLMQPPLPQLLLLLLALLLVMKMAVLLLMHEQDPKPLHYIAVCSAAAGPSFWAQLLTLSEQRPHAAALAELMSEQDQLLCLLLLGQEELLLLLLYQPLLLLKGKAQLGLLRGNLQQGIRFSR